MCTKDICLFPNGEFFNTGSLPARISHMNIGPYEHAPASVSFVKKHMLDISDFYSVLDECSAIVYTYL